MQLGGTRLSGYATLAYATRTNATHIDATRTDAVQLRTHDKADHITQRTPLTTVDLTAHGTPHCRTRLPDTNSTLLDTTERDICEAPLERNWETQLERD